MSVQIDKGIPIPPRRYGRPKGFTNVHWPFREMNVGDSLLIEGRPQEHVSGLVTATGTRLGWKLTTRNVEGGVRVWRIA